MKKTKTLCALILLAGTCFGQRQYTVTAIPSPTSDNNMVTWISDDGSTTFGVLVFGGGSVEECYSVAKGVFTPYPTPGVSCYVRDVNANLQFTGQVVSGVGQAVTQSSIGLTSYVNLNGSFDVFGPRIGGTAQSKGINIHGAVAGVAVDRNGNSVGWIYSGGQIQNLPSNFSASFSAFPSAINDNGDVAGSASPSAPWNPDNCQAAIYRNGNIINIGAPAAGPAYSVAINSSGQVAGYGTAGALSFAQAPAPGALIPVPFFYDGTTMNLIHIPGANYGAYTDALNDSGEVIGRYYPDNLDGCTATTCNFTHRAFYYYNGTAVDLNSLLVNPPAGLDLRDVSYISNSGLILAKADNDDGSWSPTYLLTPVSPVGNISGATGPIAASPNPAAKSSNGDATTTISWTASGQTWVEIHIGSPNGPLFASSLGPGSATTGPWVSNGMMFYLQNVTESLPLTAANTPGMVVENVQ
jgi:hypothetical protein